MKIYLILDSENYIIGIMENGVPPEGAIEIDNKPELKRGVLYKYLNNEVVEFEADTAYLSIKNKQYRIALVNEIVVTTTSGKVFDGDELSQDRMTRAINISSITGQTSTRWKLHNNDTIEVTLNELKEALTLAGEEMSKIWLGERDVTIK